MSQQKRSNERRVVVTGTGCITSLGLNVSYFWKNLLSGKSGISNITSVETSDLDVHFGGEIKNFDATDDIQN